LEAGVTIRRLFEVGAVGLLLGLSTFVASLCSAVTLYLPGSTVQVGVTLPAGSYDGIAVDAAGEVLVAAGSAGILKVSTLGAVSTWSSATVSDIAIAPDGTAYGAGRSLCNCIYKIAPDGTSSPLHQDTYGWTWVAVTPDGTLYADVLGGAGGGLYRVDRTTGSLDPIVLGGPGPGGLGFFWRLNVGVDGKLYPSGSPDGSTFAVYRLDGSTLTPVTIPPYGYGSLTAAPGGFDVANVVSGAQGELWLIHPGIASANLLGKADPGGLHAPPPTFSAIAYDPGASLIYAVQEYTLWGIHADLSTPAQSKTWGAVKAQYHR
jgi:hypothetical protein